MVETSAVGAVLVPSETPALNKPVIRVDSPRRVFGLFLNLCRRELPLGEGVHPAAVVDRTVELGKGARVGAYAVVEAGVLIGEGARVYPFAYVGEDCSIGENAVIYPHAVLYRDVTIGARTVVHSGAVLGADGFGFTWNGEKQVKVPQVGGVRVGADVEIGGCTTVDRAMMGETVVGQGTKIDNLVQIGHNCRIGEHTVIAAQTGISGSTTVGDRCTFAGQTATVDHVSIGSDITLTGRAAVSKNLTEPGPYRGAPAIPYTEELRLEAAHRRVPSLLKRMRELERRVADLEGREGGA
jgi:UDP-3-O-[3-hydroxymyristoyl] glucosamine N-acyltransferase